MVFYESVNFVSDIVELTKSIENRFALTIPRKEIERFKTVGQYYHWLCQNLPLSGKPTYLQDSVFEELSVGLKRMEVKKEVLRSTILESIFSEIVTRTTLWFQFQNTVKRRLPSLVRTERVSSVALTITLVLAACFSIALWGLGLIFHDEIDGALSYIVVLAVLAFFGLVSFWATAPAANQFPDEIDTMEDLARETLLLNSYDLIKSYAQIGRDDVWFLLQDAINSHVRVGVENISMETEFTHDLEFE